MVEFGIFHLGFCDFLDIESSYNGLEQASSKHV